MTQDELEASRRTFERLKPEWDAIKAKLALKWSKRIEPMDEATKEPIHSPTCYSRCLEHGLPLDPWDCCHHNCPRCKRESPFERIWKHKGMCRPSKKELVRSG